jgi:hypothetical protein
VLAASGAACTVASVGWLFLFGIGYCVAMIATAVNRGIEAQPETYPRYFWMSAAGVTMLALLEAWRNPHEIARDERPKLFQLFDIILFLPRITVAALLNFSAWAYLPRVAVPAAVRLLGRLRTQESIPLHELPLDIPNLWLRRRVLAVFEVTQLTDIRTEKGQLVLRWSALAPEAFRMAGDAVTVPEMARARAVEKKEALPAHEERPALEDRYEL